LPRGSWNVENLLAFGRKQIHGKPLLLIDRKVLLKITFYALCQTIVAETATARTSLDMNKTAEILELRIYVGELYIVA